VSVLLSFLTWQLFRASVILYIYLTLYMPVYLDNICVRNISIQLFANVGSSGITRVPVPYSYGILGVCMLVEE
jgi:hypothetical protein